MTTLVLVHGAWHGSWCRDSVRTRLKTLGHQVVAPTLVGMDSKTKDRASQITAVSR
jgi:hypothetical protein